MGLSIKATRAVSQAGVHVHAQGVGLGFKGFMVKVLHSCQGYRPGV